MDPAAEIEQLRTRIDEIAHEITACNERLIDEIASMIREWIQSTATGFVTLNAARTKALSDVELAEMREAIDELDRNVRDLVRAEVGPMLPAEKGNIYEPKPPSSTGPKHIAEPIDQAIQRTAGSLRPILEKYRYLTGQAASHWQGSPRKNKQGKMEPTHMAPSVLPWTPQMKTALNDRNKKLSERHAAERKIENLKDEMAKADAARRWNEVKRAPRTDQ